MHGCVAAHVARLGVFASAIGALAGRVALSVRNLRWPCSLVWRWRGGRGRPVGSSMHSGSSVGATDRPVVIHRAQAADSGAIGVRLKGASAHVPNGGVVVERSAFPAAADEARAVVAKSIIDAAVEAHARTPVSGVPDVDARAQPPVTGSPQHAGTRCVHPLSRNPRIAVLAV